MKIETVLESLPKGCTPADRALIEHAYEVAERAHAGQMRQSGDPYIHHCVAVAKILADLNLDPAVIAAGLLHDVVEDTLTTTDRLEQTFGGEVAHVA